MEHATYTIAQVRNALMLRWEADGAAFKALRDDCGTYVFDAVMAVLLGGAGRSKPWQTAYLALISTHCEATPWKANAGLKANKADGFKNYQQRGFFDFPSVNNKRIKNEFPEEMTMYTVCDIVTGYGDDCFRKNQRNLLSDPRVDFVNTLARILSYAFDERPVIEE